ncbi:hypothetical protein IWW48_003258 [Coemansia sp. RSA 1200]|nr:hypothetical protein IWW48_003258 [Coemansia sp. RSA 1200]
MSSSLHIRLAAWNAAANPTTGRVTAVAALKNGAACGDAEGRIWLYALETADKQADGTSGTTAEVEEEVMQLRPRCLLAAHRTPVVALRTAQVSSPSPEGSEETLISVSADGDAIVWSAVDGRCISRSRAVLQEEAFAVGAHQLQSSAVGVSLQTVEYQSAAEDLLFVFGFGVPTARVFSYPSLEIVYEWTAPHPAEWVTAHALRKRKDQFGSQLITCTTAGTIRIWRYDEFALTQQQQQHDMFGRSADLTAIGAAVDPDFPGGGGGAAESGTESVHSDGERAESPGANTTRTTPMFQLEAQYESSLGGTSTSNNAGTMASSLVINPHNDDEFLVVSPTLVRLFATQKSGELHEALRWKPSPSQQSAGAWFAGAGFLAKSDIAIWDTAGNVLSVCSQFSVQGGSAGMHMLRSRHFEATGRPPEHPAVTSLAGVQVAGTASALAKAAAAHSSSGNGGSGSPVDVLLTYTSTPDDHTLTLAFPLPLSSVSGSANNPHSHSNLPASAKRKLAEVPWIGNPRVFRMSGLWHDWITCVCGTRDVTSALVLRCGRLVLGYSDGAIRVVSPTSMMVETEHLEQKSSADNAASLSGHKQAVCALYEWQPPTLVNRHNTDDTASVGCSLLVSASKDLTIRIWDLATGACLNVLAAQSAPIVRLNAVLLPANRVAWREAEKHEALCAELDTLVLGVGSDNSTVLVSMRLLDRIHVTAPYYAQPVRTLVSWNRACVDICYSDSTKRTVSVAHLVGATVVEDSDGASAAATSSNTSSSNNTSSPSNNNKNNTSINGQPALWARLAPLLPASARCAPLGGARTPAALILEVDVMSLQTVAARVAPEGTNADAMRALLANEDDNRSSLPMMTNPLRASLMLLSVLCTWGVSTSLDAAKHRVFGMQTPLPNVSLAVGGPPRRHQSDDEASTTTVVFPDVRDKCSSWCVSPLLNAQRMLAILVLSRSALQGDEQKAVEIINFYVGKLQAEVGPNFKPLSLQALAQYWQSSNASLQRAARTLVFSVIHGIAERQRRAELFYWSSLLARSAPGAMDAEGLYALTIVCVIGTDFPSLLPLTARSMAAAMLQALVTMPTIGVRARMVGIELMSRGFATFKPYLDCHAVIRSLLSIMMGASEEAVVDSEGLGLRKTMSGVSMAALGAAAQHSNSGSASGRSSRAATPDTLSLSLSLSLARAAMDRRQAEAAATRQMLPASHDAPLQGASVRSRRPRAASMAGSDGSSGSAVSFSMVALAKSALLRICTSDAAVVSSAVCEILRGGDGGEDNDGAGVQTRDSAMAEQQTLRERRGALQLVGLAAQKYPTHMYSHVEVLAAAVVCAIDPKRTRERRALIGAAGAALQGLVRAYPFVAFHATAQCLVVGGIGGVCTAYDLRSATRTAVYAAPTSGAAASPVAAVSVSPAADRVASFTLGDGMLSIWDPSPSALAMFARSLFWGSSALQPRISDSGNGTSNSNDGDSAAPSPPPQGSVAASKTMKIPAGFLDHADELPISSVMAAAKLTWSGDRSVVLQVQEATFTLSV